MAADEDYDDTVSIPEAPLDWAELEQAESRLSLRFHAFMVRVIRAGDFVRKHPEERDTEADRIAQLVECNPDLYDYGEVVYFVVDWLRSGAPTPKPAKLSMESIGDRAEAIERQRAKRGRL